MTTSREAPWIERFLYGPQPIVRLEFIRVFAPLAILGFLSGRIPYANDWLTSAGFQIPDLGTGPHQPIYLAPLLSSVAWGLMIVTVVAGIALSIGFFTRISAAVFTLCLGYLALADRLAAFTVSKLGTIIVLALFLSPCGARWSVDAWRRHRRAPDALQPTTVSGGSVRFFQLLLVAGYFSSGVAKAKGDWLHYNDAVWSHLHYSYQTWIAYWLTQHMPAVFWVVSQWIVLAFEAGAPLWFALPWTRKPALFVGLGMHLFIGTCFGPVVWFALLMMVLLIGGYLPSEWIPRRFAALPSK